MNKLYLKCLLLERISMELSLLGKAKSGVNIYEIKLRQELLGSLLREESLSPSDYLRDLRNRNSSELIYDGFTSIDNEAIMDILYGKYNYPDSLNSLYKTYVKYFEAEGTLFMPRVETEVHLTPTPKVNDTTNLPGFYSEATAKEQEPVVIAPTENNVPDEESVYDGDSINTIVLATPIEEEHDEIAYGEAGYVDEEIALNDRENAEEEPVSINEALDNSLNALPETREKDELDMTAVITPPKVDVIGMLLNINLNSCDVRSLNSILIELDNGDIPDTMLGSDIIRMITEKVDKAFISTRKAVYSDEAFALGIINADGTPIESYGERLLDELAIKLRLTLRIAMVHRVNNE